MLTLREMFLHELSQMYDSEIQLADRLPTMRQALLNRSLRRLVALQTWEAKHHAHRLETVFETFANPPERIDSHILRFVYAGMEDSFKAPAQTLQSAVFAVATRVQHYKIASYGCLRDWSALFDNHRAIGLLDENLQEARALNETLLRSAREESLDLEPHHASQRERLVPLSKVLSARERNVLHWLAEGLLRPRPSVGGLTAGDCSASESPLHQHVHTAPLLPALASALPMASTAAHHC